MGNIYQLHKVFIHYLIHSDIVLDYILQSASVFTVQHLCQLYRLSAEAIVEEWVAFCSTKKQKNKNVHIDALEHLEREVG
jgi:DNA polymerase alpha subunit B N-terminal